MDNSIDNDGMIRFGIFEVDLQTRELRKAGLKLKLRDQPFQLLAILLEQPGRLVTREQLQNRLWPDTIVDVEHNLNTAINKIREALGDSAENPRFVETLPKRGYRFIAPLNGVYGTSVAQPPKHVVDSAAAGAGGAQAPSVLSGDKSQIGRWRLAYTFVAVAIVVVLVVVEYRWTRTVQASPSITRYVQITGDFQAKTASYVHEPVPPLVSDGSRLYFMEGPVGGKKLTQVSTAGGEATLFPAPFRIRRVLDISPDKRELLVSSSDEPLEMEVALMVLPLPAGTPRRVGNMRPHDASWSPDGSRIVYASGHELYVAKSDGSEAREVATLSGLAWWPRWSPDASLLRFTVQNTSGRSKLFEVGTDGNRLHPLFPDQSDPLAQCCGSWTADGRYFVFASSYYSTSQLWAIRESGGLLNNTHTLVQLTTGPMNVFAPLPSPDGKRLFAAAVQSRGELVRYDAKSGHFLPFLSGTSVQAGDFTKDGQRVTYVDYPGGTLWRSKIDGSGRLQLTLPPMQADLPRWSPDGKRIAFMARAATGRPLKIYLISAQGGTPPSSDPG